ncbi:LIM zinc-binding domain-containing Nebulette, partial [Antrostomus carolinensis]
QKEYKKDLENEIKGKGMGVGMDTPDIQRAKKASEIVSQVKYHEDFEKTKGRGFTPVVDDPVTERVRKNTQIVSDAAYKGVHPHIVEMDRRPGIIVAPVLPGAYQQSQSQGYGYMHQTSMSSMRSMHSQPHSAGLRTYRAMYDYSAQDEDEVSFRDGDYIINVQPIDDGWMYGTVQRTGKTGMLPANYIEFVN